MNLHMRANQVTYLSRNRTRGFFGRFDKQPQPVQNRIRDLIQKMQEPRAIKFRGHRALFFDRIPAANYLVLVKVQNRFGLFTVTPQGQIVKREEFAQGTWRTPLD